MPEHERDEDLLRHTVQEHSQRIASLSERTAATEARMGSLEGRVDRAVATLTKEHSEMRAIVTTSYEQIRQDFQAVRDEIVENRGASRVTNRLVSWAIGLGSLFAAAAGVLVAMGKI